MTRSEKKKRYDGMLIFVVLLLVAAGLVILYSTSAYNGQVKFHDPFHYLKKQGFATLLGLFGMALIARVDYQMGSAGDSRICDVDHSVCGCYIFRG